MAKKLDRSILEKLSKKIGKPEKYIREQISKKASAARVNSAAYLVFWANQEGIGIARYLATLDPYIQEQARSLAVTPVINRVQPTPPTIHKARSKVTNKQNYVDLDRLRELRSLKIKNFDLKRLVRMCEEINHCFKRRDFIATIALVRSILNHVPPIFGYRNFTEVSNNTSLARSTRESFNFLESHSRKIADAYLHIPIRDSEILPTRTQVDFSQSLDVLLGEIVRILNRSKNDLVSKKSKN